MPEQILNLARFLRENAGVEGFELADTMKGLMGIAPNSRHIR